MQSALRLETQCRRQHAPLTFPPFSFGEKLFHENPGRVLLDFLFSQQGTRWWLLPSTREFRIFSQPFR